VKVSRKSTDDLFEAVANVGFREAQFPALPLDFGVLGEMM
jgi:hypothetical protein